MPTFSGTSHEACLDLVHSDFYYPFYVSSYLSSFGGGFAHVLATAFSKRGFMRMAHHLEMPYVELTKTCIATLESYQ